MDTITNIAPLGNGPAPAARPARLAWLVLLALATLQLTIAQHASAHTLDNLTDRCALCVQLDDCGQALSSAPAVVVPAVTPVPGQPLADAVSDRRPRLSRHSRAPPSC